MRGLKKYSNMLLSSRSNIHALRTPRSRCMSRSIPAARLCHQLRPTVAVRVASKDLSEPHVQLGTADLPTTVQTTTFVESIYQWASTMSQSGANYPTALPLKVDKLDNGFQISLLKRISATGGFGSAGDIQGTVEMVPQKGKNVFFIRFYEGPASLVDRRTPASTDPDERLDSILKGLVDVQTIMQTMPNAIRKAVQVAQP